MPINKEKCLQALNINKNLTEPERREFGKLCEQGVSIAELFRNEIPRYGVCTLTDANNYIKEEEKQMQQWYGPYNMDDISVPEHVLLEDEEEPFHKGLPQGYSGVNGEVKFFVEWLEGHHPALGCMYGVPNQVPSDELYAEFARARRDARDFREKQKQIPFLPPISAIPIAYFME